MTKKKNMTDIVKYIDIPYWQGATIDTKFQSMTKIGVIDGGYVYSDDVKENINIKSEKNFVENGSEFYGVSLHSVHGKVVTDIITQLAKGSEVYSAKVFSDNYVTTNLVIQKAIDWLIKSEVKIINMSLGTYCSCHGDCELSEYIRLCKEKYGIIFIVSAGNQDEKNHKNGYITCPGCAHEAITVGALNKNLVPDSSINLDSSLLVGKPNLYQNGYISYKGKNFSGTSFAAPIITAMIAKRWYSTMQYFNTNQNICDYLVTNRLAYG